MALNTKLHPKSCSCNQCKRGKGSKAGKQQMKLDERAFRRKANLATKKGGDVPIVPVGNYYD